MTITCSLTCTDITQYTRLYHFASIEMWPSAASIEPSTFGSAAEQRNHYTTAADIFCDITYVSHFWQHHLMSVIRLLLLAKYFVYYKCQHTATALDGCEKGWRYNQHTNGASWHCASDGYITHKITFRLISLSAGHTSTSWLWRLVTSR